MHPCSYWLVSHGQQRRFFREYVYQPCMACETCIEYGACLQLGTDITNEKGRPSQAAATSDRMVQEAQEYRTEETIKKPRLDIANEEGHMSQAVAVSDGMAQEAEKRCTEGTNKKAWPDIVDVDTVLAETDLDEDDFNRTKIEAKDGLEPELLMGEDDFNRTKIDAKDGLEPELLMVEYRGEEDFNRTKIEAKKGLEPEITGGEEKTGLSWDTDIDRMVAEQYGAEDELNRTKITAKNGLETELLSERGRFVDGEEIDRMLEEMANERSLAQLIIKRIDHMTVVRKELQERALTAELGTWLKEYRDAVVKEKDEELELARLELGQLEASMKPKHELYFTILKDQARKILESYCVELRNELHDGKDIMGKDKIEKCVWSTLTWLGEHPQAELDEINKKQAELTSIMDDCWLHVFKM